MRTIGAVEAEDKLGTLLNWVEQGEEIVTTRCGKSVAKLVPSSPGFDREAACAAAERIIERSRGAPPLAA